MPDLRLSYSGSNSYKHCPKLYKLHYIDKLRGLKVMSFLPFGAAVDKALNFILESIRDQKSYDDYLSVFHTAWDTVEIAGQAFKTAECPYVEYLANDIDESYLTPEELRLDKKTQAYLCLRQKGAIMLSTYIEEFVPKLDKVLAVQVETNMNSSEGSQLVGVVDFIATLKGDGEPILFDNKTASKKYPKNSVVKSEQLSSYCYATGLKRAGYVVITKKFEKGTKPEIQILVDNIDPAVEEQVIDNLSEIAHKINLKEFEPNFGAACNSYFGSKCPYYAYCRNGSMENLVKKV